MIPEPDELIENALRTHSLAELPPRFSEGVMQRVQSMPAAYRFRLTWMDYALSLFVSILPIAGFAVWYFLPREVLLDLQFQWQVLQSSRLQPLVVLPLGVAGALLFFAFVISLNIVLRPRLAVR
jgi:hypothetical protein